MLMFRLFFHIILITLFTACGRDGELIIFEDAENGLSPNWHVVRGETSPQRIKATNSNNGYCISLPVHWDTFKDGSQHNPHEYHLDLAQKFATHLEVDVGGTGMRIPHYILGVKVQTLLGERVLLWDSYYNHEGLVAKITYKNNGAANIIGPSPIELVRGFGYERTDLWEHFDVNIEAFLHKFEPNNNIISVDKFIATGGNLDNIGLSIR